MLKGFSTKFAAPARIVSTALSTSPCAVNGHVRPVAAEFFKGGLPACAQHL